MLSATWVLLPMLVLHASSMMPPMPAALDSPSEDQTTPVDGAPPEKRLIKYLLPSTGPWAEDEATQEEAKRGYGRNYLRFGRNDEEKRGGRNFLRFGRGDSDYQAADSDVDSADVEKRNRNFLRFGRGPNNFLRFGRSGAMMSPLDFARGMEEKDAEDNSSSMPEEEKRGRHLNYLRFGRGNSRNFLRFGRNEHRNFLRFGRSVDRQLLCSGCQEKNMAATSSSAAASPVKRNADLGSEREEAVSVEGHRQQRTKRSAPPTVLAMGGSSDSFHSPLYWARSFQPQAVEEEQDLLENSPLEEQMNKRGGYNRSFIRFGRNRNFLRFGKRSESDLDSDESSSSSSSSGEASDAVMLVVPREYPRSVRGASKNFLRFG